MRELLFGSVFFHVISLSSFLPCFYKLAQTLIHLLIINSSFLTSSCGAKLLHLSFPLPTSLLVLVFFCSVCCSSVSVIHLRQPFLLSLRHSHKLLFHTQSFCPCSVLLTRHRRLSWPYVKDFIFYQVRPIHKWFAKCTSLHSGLFCKARMLTRSLLHSLRVNEVPCLS